MIKILCILFSATSTLAWSAHSRCAVMVDDATVITNEAHLGQAASRGNPQLPHGRPPQHPQQHLQPVLLVYDAMREASGPAMPSRRMRRSVSHEMPPRMDTHPPDSSSPNPHTTTDSPTSDSFLKPSHSSDSTLSGDSLSVSPQDSTEDTRSYPAPSPHHLRATAEHSIAGNTFLIPDSDSPLESPFVSSKPTVSSSAESDSLLTEEHHPLKSVESNAKKLSRTVTRDDRAILDEAQKPEGDVFAPVVEVVEYVNDEGLAELPEVDDGAFLKEDQNSVSEDSFLNGEEVIEETATSSYGEIENIIEDVYEEEKEAEFEYVYNSNPESDELNVVEYIQANETEGNVSNSSLELSESYMSIPNASVNTSEGGKLSSEFLPVPLASDTLQSVMLGDDPSTSKVQESDAVAAAAEVDDKVKRERKVFGSWMGGFPKLPSESSEGDSIPGNDPPRQPQRPSPPEGGEVTRVFKSSVDAWFSRYGLKDVDGEDTNGNDARSEGASSSYHAMLNDHFLFDSSERSGGRMSRRSAARRGSSYDPNDPKGGPIPQSDPGHYPSRILESLGVPYYQEPTRAPNTTNNRTYKGPVIARDVFPHIFEYDLDDHDDYYYEDDAYYYFDEYSVKDNGPAERESSESEEINDDDESDDIIFDDDEAEGNIGNIEPAHRDASVVTMRAPSQWVPLLPATSTPVRATHYPPGLRAMSLTREEFHVGVGEPQVRTLTQGQDEVVEIEVVPLKNTPMNSMETGTNYSPVLDNLNRETTVERKVMETSTAVDATMTSPAAAATSTDPPPPPTVHSYHLPEESSPTQGAQAISTSPPHHRPMPFNTENLPEGKKIPKFLIHIAENKPPASRGFHTPNTDRPPSLSDGDNQDSSQQAALLSLPNSPAQNQMKESHEERVDTNRRSSLTSNDEAVYSPNHSESGTQPLSSHTGKGKTYQENVVSQELHRANRSPLQHAESTLASAPGHSKRVTVNVTIATDDGEKIPGRTMNHKKPLYFLSVSVPTSGENQEADITLVEPNDQHEIASLSFPINPNNDDSSGDGSQTESMSMLPQRDDSRFPTSNERGGLCQCPCACDSDTSHNTASHTSQSHPEVAPTFPRPNVPNPHLPLQGCAQDPTATSTTTTSPPLPVEVVKELKGETEHLHSI